VVILWIDRPFNIWIMKFMEHNKQEGEEIINNNIMVEKKDKFLPISILIAAIVIGGALVFVALYKAGPSGGTAIVGGTGGAGAQGAAVPTTNTGVMTLGSRDAILGSANAPVTMVEYGDYQCPFCGTEFYAQTEPLIIQNYVNTGKVKFVFRDFPFLGPESTAAANAAQCANDQGKLWAYHDALYSAKVADDAKGGSENDGFFSTAELLKLGQQVGLNMTTFTSCVQNNSDANMVAQEKTDATAQGVNSTPTFYINGTQILGAQPYAQFQQALDAAVAAAK
jgi:protein-disulfide isomerase